MAGGAREAAERQTREHRAADEGGGVRPAEIAHRIDHVLEGCAVHRAREAFQPVRRLADDLRGHGVIALAEILAGPLHGRGKSLEVLGDGHLLVFGKPRGALLRFVAERTRALLDLLVGGSALALRLGGGAHGILAHRTGTAFPHPASELSRPPDSRFISCGM